MSTHNKFLQRNKSINIFEEKRVLSAAVSPPTGCSVTVTKESAISTTGNMIYLQPHNILSV